MIECSLVAAKRGKLDKTREAGFARPLCADGSSKKEAGFA
jgi:hypothetical protein